MRPGVVRPHQLDLVPSAPGLISQHRHAAAPRRRDGHVVFVAPPVDERDAGGLLDGGHGGEDDQLLAVAEVVADLEGHLVLQAVAGRPARVAHEVPLLALGAASAQPKRCEVKVKVH